MTELQIQYWSMVIQAIMGIVTALIGIGGVLVGHYVLSKANHRKSLDDFWHEYAVKEGTQPLLTYVSNLEERISEVYFKVSRPDGQWDTDQIHLKRQIAPIPVPLTAVYRVVEMTSCAEVMGIIDEGEAYLEFVKSEESAKEIHGKIFELNRFLRAINTMFLVARIENRGDIVFTSSRQPVMEAADDLRDAVLRGKTRTHEEILHLKYSLPFNIFGESEKSKKQLLNSLKHRNGAGEPPQIS